MSKLSEFRKLYQELKYDEIWGIDYVSTGKVLRFEDAPNLLIGKVPVYEMTYQPIKLDLQKKQDLYSALIRSRIFDNYEDAKEMASKLNSELCITEENTETLER